MELTRQNRYTRWGFALLLPSALFLLAVVLDGLGFPALMAPVESIMAGPHRGLFNIVSPLVFLGGSFAALALNVYAISRLEFERAAGRRLVARLTVNGTVSEFLVIGVSFLICATFVLYAIAENWQCWAGLKVVC